MSTGTIHRPTRRWPFQFISSRSSCTNSDRGGPPRRFIPEPVHHGVDSRHRHPRCECAATTSIRWRGIHKRPGERSRASRVPTAMRRGEFRHRRRSHVLIRMRVRSATLVSQPGARANTQRVARAWHLGCRLLAVPRRRRAAASAGSNPRRPEDQRLCSRQPRPQRCHRLETTARGSPAPPRSLRAGRPSSAPLPRRPKRSAVHHRNRGVEHLWGIRNVS